DRRDEHRAIRKLQLFSIQLERSLTEGARVTATLAARMATAALLGHARMLLRVDTFSRAQRHAILRAARPGERGFDGAEGELHYVRILRGGCAIGAPESLGAGIVLHEANLLG